MSPFYIPANAAYFIYFCTSSCFLADIFFSTPMHHRHHRSFFPLYVGMLLVQFTHLSLLLLLCILGRLLCSYRYTVKVPEFQVHRPILI